MRDFKRLQHDPPAGISGAPQDNNIMLWNAVIFGLVPSRFTLVALAFRFLGLVQGLVDLLLGKYSVSFVM